MVFSDDLVWAFSTDAGGPLDPGLFSVQLPQSVVLKSAEHVLAKYAPETLLASPPAAKKQDTKAGASEHYLMNRGRPLPSSGVSVVQLLRELVEEDRQAELEAAQGNSTATTSASTTAVGRSRRLTTAGLNEEEQASLDESHRFLLQGGAGKVKQSAGGKQGKIKDGKTNPAAAAPAHTNTLIRLLHKISAADVASLQAGVRETSQHFQFYAMNASMRTDVTPPAIHAHPGGGAMAMLDQLLAQRKTRGILDTSQRCQVTLFNPCDVPFYSSDQIVGFTRHIG